MFYKSSKAEVSKEGVWNEQTCLRRTGGYDIDLTALPEGTKYLPKGTVMALVNHKIVPVKAAKAYAAAEAQATELKVEKGHLLKVGDTVAGSAISKITTGADFDTLTVAALADKVKTGDALVGDNVENVIGLLYATVKLDDMPSGTVTVQAYEIDEDTLPYPVNDAIKEALTSRHDWLKL